jgi:hypothetical protein
MKRPQGRPVTNTRLHELMALHGCSRTWAYKLLRKEDKALKVGAKLMKTVSRTTALTMLLLLSAAATPCQTRFNLGPDPFRLMTHKANYSLTATSVVGDLLDGLTTRRLVGKGYQEGDPVSRAFIGRRPTWSRMAPFGTVELTAVHLVGLRMRASLNPWVRGCWWVPQATDLAAHLWAVGHNYQLLRKEDKAAKLSRGKP